MNTIGKSAALLTVTLLLSLVTFGRAESSARKSCVKNCKDTYSADLDACKTKKGKARKACHKKVKQQIERCKKACRK